MRAVIVCAKICDGQPCCIGPGRGNMSRREEIHLRYRDRRTRPTHGSRNGDVA
jgi:hypothetical protein